MFELILCVGLWGKCDLTFSTWHEDEAACYRQMDAIERSWLWQDAEQASMYCEPRLWKR